MQSAVVRLIAAVLALTLTSAQRLVDVSERPRGVHRCHCPPVAHECTCPICRQQPDRPHVAGHDRHASGAPVLRSSCGGPTARYTLPLAGELFVLPAPFVPPSPPGRAVSMILVATAQDRLVAPEPPPPRRA